MIAHQLGLADIEIVSSPQDVADIKTLHTIAVSVNQLKGEAERAMARGDMARVEQVATSLTTMQGIFRTVAVRFTQSDPSALTFTERALLAIGNIVATVWQWVRDGVQALPGAVAAIPVAVIDGLELILRRLAKGTRNVGFEFAVLPVVLLAAALVLVGQAEKTRTYRRYVA